jgi:CMP-N-acetylneuraminic acid synthetase
MTRIVALVPMRHHSQRVPGKNFRPLAGKPLYYHILTTLTSLPDIEQIVVDTDSDEIMEGLRKDFPQVKTIRRPENLRADEVSMNEIIVHDTGQIRADFYLQTHSTNPLIKPETIRRAIQAFLAGYPAYDSLFSVTPLQSRLYDESGKALNHDPKVLLQTQDLPPVYAENSCLYIFTRNSLMERRHRIGRHPLMFVMDADEAWDIDNELDFSVCECLIQRNLKTPGAGA